MEDWEDWEMTDDEWQSIWDEAFDDAWADFDMDLDFDYGDVDECSAWNDYCDWEWCPDDS